MTFDEFKSQTYWRAKLVASLSQDELLRALYEQSALVRAHSLASRERALGEVEMIRRGESRQEAYEHVSAMAGLDANGGILPPPPGFKIDRSPVSWWRNMAGR